MSKRSQTTENNLRTCRHICTATMFFFELSCARHCNSFSHWALAVLPMETLGDHRMDVAFWISRSSNFFMVQACELRCISVLEPDSKVGGATCWHGIGVLAQLVNSRRRFFQTHNLLRLTPLAREIPGSHFQGGSWQTECYFWDKGSYSQKKKSSLISCFFFVFSQKCYAAWQGARGKTYSWYHAARPSRFVGFFLPGKLDFYLILIPVVDRPCLALVRQCRKKNLSFYDFIAVQSVFCRCRLFWAPCILNASFESTLENRDGISWM